MDKGGFEKARDYAFLLLKYRPRSVREIKERLTRKGYAAETAARVASFLEEKGFLDDRQFAAKWIEERLRKPFGFRRISQELAVKGVCREIISRSGEEALRGYDEEQAVEKSLFRKLGRKKEEDLTARKRRLYSYCLRRGFSPDSILAVLNRLLKDADTRE